MPEPVTVGSVSSLSIAVQQLRLPEMPQKSIAPPLVSARPLSPNQQSQPLSPRPRRLQSAIPRPPPPLQQSSPRPAQQPCVLSPRHQGPVFAVFSASSDHVEESNYGFESPFPLPSTLRRTVSQLSAHKQSTTQQQKTLPFPVIIKKTPQAVETDDVLARIERNGNCISLNRTRTVLPSQEEAAVLQLLGVTPTSVLENVPKIASVPIRDMVHGTVVSPPDPSKLVSSIADGTGGLDFDSGVFKPHSVSDGTLVSGYELTVLAGHGPRHKRSSSAARSRSRSRTAS